MTRHVPVLLPEALSALDVSDGDTVFDGTVGSGGHAKALCAAVGEDGRIVGTDLDKWAIADVKEVLGECEADLCLREENFRRADQVLRACEVDSLQAGLLDLGFRSEQLEMNRGFSFQKESPLLMTYTHPDELEKKDLTAKQIVNEWKVSSIKSLLEGYANERYSEQIAEAIGESRKHEQIETTTDLVSIIKEATPKHYHSGSLHPATRTFQALRIAVNDEIQALDEGLEKIFSQLEPGGRLAVISFHSVEDRTVKQAFEAWSDQGLAEILTDTPVTPKEEEVDYNPRARSGKLRAVEKMSD